MNITKKKQIAEFFDKYETSFNQILADANSDVGPVALCFSNCFISANPTGVYCGNNDPAYLDAIKQGYAAYRNMGIKRMELTGKDIAELNELYFMAKIQWRSHYLSKSGSPGFIDFEVIYLLFVKGNDCKIFAYITGDEQDALEKHGLLHTGNRNNLS